MQFSVYYLYPQINNILSSWHAQKYPKLWSDKTRRAFVVKHTPTCLPWECARKDARMPEWGKNRKITVFTSCESSFYHWSWKTRSGLKAKLLGTNYRAGAGTQNACPVIRVLRTRIIGWDYCVPQEIFYKKNKNKHKKWGGHWCKFSGGEAGRKGPFG